jgi:hypothetical protein
MFMRTDEPAYNCHMQIACQTSWFWEKFEIHAQSPFLKLYSMDRCKKHAKKHVDWIAAKLTSR